ncbi:LSU ribosomal protein L10p (P0) [Candidatus Syntrophocurvum alkaliphilum]|uniref:Large ribosomal subunit protein uL10 n=1 Tax=Candidatus Syntrophocurvum alkaliphilum TaxID=2293317 RepID=A0A6I6DLV7_9FIRM|nr:50S ribosomal protein L10 [Candidatus Syntrophocurvum alkaliphilum]QGU00767.1 LSU ribosomal protein L10p (P0) [Candidatus Syntrophocurvum alkaliphilum]
MSKIEEKQKLVKEIEQKIKDSKLVVFTDFRGLNVDEVSELRNKLRVPGVEYKVLKNTMVRFALQNNGQEDIAEKIVGPNAILFSEEDPVGPAKTLFEFAKTHKNLEVKLGILEGQMVEANKVKELADLPSREVLVAQVLGTMQAPITGFVNVLNANITGLVRALDQIKDQKEAC